MQANATCVRNCTGEAFASASIVEFWRAVTNGRHRLSVFEDGRVHRWLFFFGMDVPSTEPGPRTIASGGAPKIEGNVARDRDTDRRLTDAGWIVARIWTHEAVETAVDRIEAVVRRAFSSQSEDAPLIDQGLPNCSVGFESRPNHVFRASRNGIASVNVFADDFVNGFPGDDDAPDPSLRRCTAGIYTARDWM